MADQVIPQPLCAWNANGRPSAGAKATFFLSGTTTPATVYANEAETVPHPTPLVADGFGRFPPIYRSGVALKCVLTDAFDATLPGSPIDPVPIVRDGGGTASEITFTASADLPFTNVQTAIEGAFDAITGQTAPFTAMVKLVNGSASAPAFAAAGDTNTGGFFPADDKFAVGTGGTTRVTVSNADVTVAVPILAPDGSAIDPAYSNTGDTNSGIYFPGPDQVGIATGSVKRVAVSSTMVEMTVPVGGAAKHFIGGLPIGVSGTVNAIVINLSGGTVVLTDGMCFNFFPPGDNTAGVTLSVDGSTAKTCITEDGTALPAGYLQSAVLACARYDGAYFRIFRTVEYAATPNGEYWRYGDGRQVCLHDGAAQDVSTASGSIFISSAAGTWTFPAPFSGLPSLQISPNNTTGRWGLGAPTSGSSATYRHAAAVSSAATFTSKLIAVGRWY